MMLWEKITFFGDSVVLLPAAMVIAIWLIAARGWRMATAWCALFAFGLFIVAASKIAFMGWGIGIRSLDFTGFSGHAMRATAVIPVMVYLLLQNSAASTRHASVALGFGVGALLSLSRVAVGAHSISEAVLGALLGVAVSGTFLWIARGRCAAVTHRWLIALSMAGMLGTSHAQPAPTHRWISGVALYLSGNDKLYDRSMWHTQTCRIDRDSPHPRRDAKYRPQVLRSGFAPVQAESLVTIGRAVSFP
jgi:membrane-associated phospholipid phosphatase